MSCLYAKRKINGDVTCKKKNKNVTIYDCFRCNEFKQKRVNQKTLKKVTPRLIEKQKQRFSIIYQNLNNCVECGSNQAIELNEVFEGAKRGVSMENGFVMPLCNKCHRKFHSNREMALKYKKKFQTQYEKTHTRDEFLNLIHKSYLE